MTLKKLGLLTLCSLSLAVLSELAYRGWRRWRRKDAPVERRRRTSVHEVIMFRPHEEGGAGLERSKYSRCLITPQLRRVVTRLCSARRSLDAAIYVLTSVDIANAILSLIRTGVAVRFVVDADMAYASGAQVRRLENAGANVRWRKSTCLMHHKFCLIDTNADDEQATPLLMTGSLNWTTQAVNGNWENVVVTSQETIVAQYKAEFERLWAEFKVVVGPPTA